MRNTTRFSIVGFVRNLYFYLPIFTLFLLDKGISIEVVVFSQTFYSLAQFFAEVPTGLFADKYGQKFSIIIGYIIEALGIAAVILWPTEAGLYICYALGGLAMAFLSGSEEALLYESAKVEKTNFQRAYGRFLALQTWGMVAGTALGGLAVYLYGAASYPWLLVGTAVSLAFCAVLSLSLHSHRAHIAEAELGAGLIGMLKKSTKLIRSDDTVYNLTIGAMLTLSGEYILLGIYQPVFVDSGVPVALLGVIFAVGLGFSALLVHRADLFERYLALDRIILYIALTLAIGYAVMGFSHYPVVLVIAFLIIRSLMEVQTPIVSDYINEHVSSDIRSTTLSSISLVSRFASVLLHLLLAGAIALGGARVGFFTLSVYLAIGGCIAFWLYQRCGCVHRISAHAAK